MKARLFMAWLRLLLFTAFLHVGGFAVAAIAMDPCADETGCCTDCPIEKSGEECPPGCPDCHCHHGGGAIAMPEVEGNDLARPARDLDSAETCPHEATAPRAPALPSVFRPPRALPLFT